jgi:hypothetical protein
VYTLGGIGASRQSQRADKERTLRHSAIDSLDQKVGVLLAFVSLFLVGLSIQTIFMVQIVVGSFILVSGCFALRALWVGTYKGLNIEHFRHRFLTEKEPDEALILLDTLISEFGNLRKQIYSKRWKVVVSTIFSGIGIFLLVGLSIYSM